MNIRPAEAGDGDAIWKMLKPVFRDGDTYAIDPGIERAAALSYWLAERTYVAEDDAVRGTFYIKENQRGGGAHVCNCGFVTARGSEGRGVARAMLEAALSQAKAIGFVAMQFNFVLESNGRAVALWQSAGFEIVGRQPRAFRHPDGRYTDALIMHRYLD